MHASTPISLRKAAPRRPSIADGERAPIAWLQTARVAAVGLPLALAAFVLLKPLFSELTLAGGDPLGDAWAAGPLIAVGFLMVYVAYRPLLAMPIVTRRRNRRLRPSQSVPGTCATWPPATMPLFAPLYATGDLKLAAALSATGALWLIAALEFQRRTCRADRTSELRYYDKYIEAYLPRYRAAAGHAAGVALFAVYLATVEPWADVVALIGMSLFLVSLAPFWRVINERSDHYRHQELNGADWWIGAALPFIAIPFFADGHGATPNATLAVGIACMLPTVACLELARRAGLRVQVARAVRKGRAYDIADVYGLGPAADD